MSEKKSIDERIDEQNRSRPVRTHEKLPGHTSLTTEQRPTETHNAVSSPDGDKSGENKVATSLDDE